MNRRFVYAMLTYAALAVLAAVTSDAPDPHSHIGTSGRVRPENLPGGTERPNRLSEGHTPGRIDY